MTIRARALPWASTLILLIGVAMAGNGQTPDITFSGLFDTTITTTQTAPVTLTSMGIDLILGIGEATAQMSAQLSDSSFDTLTLSATAPLGGLNLNSSLQFNPSTVKFISWQSGATFTLLDVAFSNLTNVVDPQTNSYTQWSVSGTAGELGLQGTVKLGICPLEFWEASVCGNWIWLDCFANMSVCVQFDGIIGFRNITATMTNLVLFEDFWGIQGNLDTAIVFSANEKVLTPTLRFTPAWFFCTDIELLGELSVTPPLTIENLGFYGIRGECAVGECVSFTFADSLDDAKNSSITGKAEYFERFGITGCLPSCCGSDGSFEVNAYFERPPAPSGTLFGMGLITVSFDFQLFSNFAFAFAGEFPMASSDWELAWTFRVLW